MADAQLLAEAPGFVFNETEVNRLCADAEPSQLVPAPSEEELNAWRRAGDPLGPFADLLNPFPENADASNGSNDEFLASMVRAISESRLSVVAGLSYVPCRRQQGGWLYLVSAGPCSCAVCAP